MIEKLETGQTNGHRHFRHEFAIDVLKGLSEKPKRLPSKYFYDDRGSRLFSEITRLEEYYPTQCERDVFLKNKGQISALLPKDHFNLIELGAGDGQKTRILIEQFLNDRHQFEYLPIDISESAVSYLEKRFQNLFPDLKQTGVVGEYYSGINWVRENRPGQNVVLFLGSNIGNFDAHEAITFLKILWKNLNHGDYLLIGFDLKKDVKIMTRAYNDSQGITREFNLNLLNHINRELNGNFDPEKFMHYGTYNPVIGAMESFLISRERQDVYVGEVEKTFSFEAFEPIHLEYSNKYLIDDIECYARESGFSVVEHYHDSKNYFVDSLWRAVKEPAT
jgi:L-histidine Nalpha-methyltransferase